MGWAQAPGIVEFVFVVRVFWSVELQFDGERLGVLERWLVV